MNSNKIRELIDKLNYYTKLYDEGHPEISDKEWDDLYFELVNLENTYNIYFEDSPTQRVNYEAVNELEKIEHNHKMLSLEKTKDADVIKSFVGEHPYLAMLKMDGLTCSLRYVNGKLVGAETRGNGIIGENILHNALQVRSVPNRINYTDELIVDGEIICTYKDFEPFSNEYKNPRNFASGSIRLLDSAECAKRNLTFVAWEVIKGFDNEIYFANRLNNLASLGFIVVDNMMSNDRNVENQIETLKYFAEQKGYPIDGLVFKFNDIEYGKSLGSTDHHFKNAMAYKFYDEEYETTLVDVEWTMGRTGVLTPVAILKPIDIDGTEVSRASLHNISIMEELLKYAPFKGQKVYVYKANMIIPQISRSEELFMDTVVDEFEYIHIPKICPVCGGATKIIQENESKVLMCDNPQCEGKLINRLDHFFGKKGLDAKGLSKATFEKLINWGWVERISDVFELRRHETEWKNTQGFGEKSVGNILRAIDESCNTNFESIISAAGIPLIGRTNARDLAKRFDSYNSYKSAIKSGYDFSSLDGFGYEMNKAITEFDYTELDYIVENFIHFKKEDAEMPAEKNFDGVQFCVTGKVTAWKNRDELKRFIEDRGGKVTDSVTAKTKYLINNDINSTSAKNKRAKELGIEIITEDDFKKIFDI